MIAFAGDASTFEKYGKVCQRFLGQVEPRGSKVL
jgi:hypothetical protein